MRVRRLRALQVLKRIPESRIDLVPIIETGPFELSILQRKAQWLHEVQRRFRRQNRPMFPVFGRISGSTKQH
jgi:hypothetical protein